jgi:hypothetical protein
MSEGELKKRFEKTLDGYIDRDDGDFWKVQHNLTLVLDECAKEFPKVKIKIGSWDDPIDFTAPEKLRIDQLNAIYEWRKKWFGDK